MNAQIAFLLLGFSCRIDGRLRDIHEELRQNRLNIFVEYGSKSESRLYTSELEPILRTG
jgi:hypothetical protein